MTPRSLEGIYFKHVNIVIPSKSQTLHSTINTLCKPVRPEGDSVIGDICCPKIRITCFIDRSIKPALYQAILQKNNHSSIYQLKYKWFIQQIYKQGVFIENMSSSGSTFCIIKISKELIDTPSR